MLLQVELWDLELWLQVLLKCLTMELYKLQLKRKSTKAPYKVFKMLGKVL
ncbi:Uncharacterised protein [Mycobacteroides abscessus subsp. massiliense]|nr:Uncharacterised protein [Mycobacteroides abscessus subsp. massiliense]